MRTIGLDLGRHTGEAACIDETGRTSSLGRLDVRRDALAAFAASLGPPTRSSSRRPRTRGPSPTSSPPTPGGSSSPTPSAREPSPAAKVKTDEIDARTLAELLAADYIPSVWQPDPATRELRRRVAFRAGLVRTRTLLRNRVHAILGQALIEVPVSDVFGVRGRAWLGSVELGPDAREALAAPLRLHDATAREVDRAERAIATAVVDHPFVRHLMTIPGVGMATAAAIQAVVGDVGRFPRGQAGQLTWASTRASASRGPTASRVTSAGPARPTPGAY